MDTHNHRSMLRRAALVAVALMAGSAQAQIINGDFSQGGAGWSWKKAATSNSWDCASKMTAVPAELQALNGPGYAAVLRGQVNYSLAAMTTCAELAQEIDIPSAGKQLNFEYQLGARIPYHTTPSHYQEVALSVFVEPVGAAPSYTALWTKYGTSQIESSFNYCNSCPSFVSAKIDLLKFAGQRVRLRFRTQSSERNYGAFGGWVQSPAFVDNVRLTDAPPLTHAQPTSGSWYNPQRSGNGLNLSQTLGGERVLTWYTFLPSGEPVWYLSDTAPIVRGVWQAALYKASFLNGNVSLTVVGDVRLKFHSNTSATFDWDLYTINGAQPYGVFDGTEYMTHLFGGQQYTGQWYNPDSSGWGVNVDYQNNPSGPDTAVTVFYYAGSEPVWAQGTVEGTPTANKLIGLTRYTGYGLCPGCSGQPQLYPSAAGSMGLSLSGDSGAGWTKISQTNGVRWTIGAPNSPVWMERLTF